jgi:hypothetical protein
MLAAAYSRYVDAENRLLAFDYSEEHQTLLKVAAFLIRMADDDYRREKPVCGVIDSEWLHNSSI